MQKKRSKASRIEITPSYEERKKIITPLYKRRKITLPYEKSIKDKLDLMREEKR